MGQPWDNEHLDQAGSSGFQRDGIGELEPNLPLRRASLHMVIMLAPSKYAGDDTAAADDGAGAAPRRRAPAQRAAGSADAAEIRPEQI